MKKILLSLFAGIGIAASTFAQMPVANFTATPTTLCAGKSVSWTNLSTNVGGGTNFLWLFPGATAGGGTPTQSTAAFPSARTYGNPGVYDVTLIVDNGGSNVDTLVKVGYITVLSSPTVTTTPSPYAYLCIGGSVTLTASGANSYTWSPATSLNTNTGPVVVSTRTTNITYTVVGTNSNGCGNMTSVGVTVNNAAPGAATSITGPTNVCSGQTALYYSNPGYTNPPIRTWTVPAGATIVSGQGTRSITVTFGSTSGQVCCTQSNACGTSVPTCTTVSVNATPAVGSVGTISGPSAVCANQSGVTYSVAPVANAASYNWTVPGTATVTAGQGTNTITVDFGGTNGQVCVSASNSCNTSSQVCKTVNVSGSAPAVPGTITGATTVCNGEAGVQYTVPFAGTGITYTWSTAATASITAGQGTRTVTITFGSASETVCVTASNACGTSNANCSNVFVDPSPALGSIGTITGASAACANQTNVTYTIPAVANASSYNWTVNGGSNATITAGQGTNTVTVDFAANNANLCVTALNNCGSTAQVCKSITVSASTPTIPGAITGPTTLCASQTGVNYSVGNVAGATVYTWSTTGTGTITAGQGTRTVTIDFASASETVCVTAGNACGTSSANCTNVTVSPNPAVGTIGTINGPTAICANQSGVNYTMGSVANATSYNWSITPASSGTITAGAGTNTITVSFGSGSGIICVDASNSCSTSSQDCQGFTAASSAPGIPASISGPTTVCAGQTIDYVSSNASGATVYTWSTSSTATIIAGQGTKTVTITFGSTATTLSVTAGNACGTSNAQALNVIVDPAGVVGTIGSITGPTSVCLNQTNGSFSIVPVTNATTYTWTITPAGTGTITAGQGTTTVSVDFGNTSGQICVDAGNSCSSAPQVCENITVIAASPTIPGAITGPTTICSGTSGVQYSISSVPNATNYTWTVPSGASITAGQGTTNLTVTFGANSGTVSVTASNACGTSNATFTSVYVDPNPAVGPISNITGPTAICANQTNVTYVLPAVSNATTYNWTVPSAANITAGQGTNTVTVTFGNVSGNICVDASNSCGVSPSSCLTLTVSPNAPSIPISISGNTTVCSGQVGNYSVAPVSNATSYNWSVPAGATVTSGQGTNNVTITFGSTSGTMSVTASNGCGTSNPSTQAIVVSSSVLTVSTTVTDATNSSACDGSATAAPAGGTGPFTYAWTPSGGNAATASGLCVGSYTVCVTDAAGCVTCDAVTVSSPTGTLELTDNGTIKVFPNPANTFVMVEGTLSGSANLNISIINMFGQRMINETVNANGSFSQKVSIEGIPAGVYFIQISAGSLVRNSRIIKIN